MRTNKTLTILQITYYLQPTIPNETKAKEFAFKFINGEEITDYEIFDYLVNTSNELFAKYVLSRSKEDTTSVKTTLDKIKLDMLFECDWSTA